MTVTYIRLGSLVFNQASKLLLLIVLLVVDYLWLDVLLIDLRLLLVVLIVLILNHLDLVLLARHKIWSVNCLIVWHHLLVLEDTTTKLEFSEMDENMFKRRSSDLEIRYQTLVLNVDKGLEDCTELHSWLLLTQVIERFNLVEHFDLASCLGSITWWLLFFTFGNSLLESIVSWSLVHHAAIVESEHNLVTFSIFLLKVTRWANTDELTIDHDCNFVAESFSLIHSMSCQHDWWIFEVLQHLEETSSRDRVNSCCWLIQEFNLWVGKEWNSTA